MSTELSPRVEVLSIGLALVASLFMPDVPLRAQRQPAG